MRTRFFIFPAALLSLAVVLAVPACRLLTNNNTDMALTQGQGQSGHDTTGTGGGPPPPPTGLSIGVSGDSSATAGNPSFLELFVGNNDRAAVRLNYKFLGPEGWPGIPASGSLTVQGQSSDVAFVRFTVPAGTAPGAYIFHYVIEQANGTTIRSGDFSYSVIG
jgi:hypothetical protein